jgi:hypothetical protein
MHRLVALPGLIPRIARGFKPESRWGRFGAEGSNYESNWIRSTRFTALIGGLSIGADDSGKGGTGLPSPSVHSAAIGCCIDAPAMG